MAASELHQTVGQWPDETQHSTIQCRWLAGHPAASTSTLMHTTLNNRTCTSPLTRMQSINLCDSQIT